MCLQGDSSQILLTSLCCFEQLHLTGGVVICVNDVQLLGKNIPCKFLILLYFHKLGESGYFIIEIRILAVCMYYDSPGLEKKSVGLTSI